jgi:tight adherence protein B
MKWVILFMVLFSSFLFFTSIQQLLFMSDKRLEKRMKHYLASKGEKRLDKKVLNFFVQLRLYKQALRQQMVNKKKSSKIEKMLGQAGVPLKPEEFILFRWMATALGGGFFYLLTGQILFLLIGIGLGYFFPGWWMRKKKKDRMNKFNEALADMISTIIGSLRAGFSFPQSLKTVSEEADSPIKDEIETVLKEMQYGSTIDDALAELKERMPSEDLDLMIEAILIQKQVGGNLATILETIVQTIRDRNKIQRQIQTLTAQGRLSGIVIGLLPLVLGFVIYLIEPDYIATLFTHPIGMIMMVVGVISGIIGLITIRKMTTIEV